MKVIHGGHKSGKTIELMKLCAEEKAHLVVNCRAEADRVWTLSRKLGIELPQPISYDEFLYLKSTYHTPVFIDDVEMFLTYLGSSRFPVLGFSYTDTKEETNS